MEIRLETGHAPRDDPNGSGHRWARCCAQTIPRLYGRGALPGVLQNRGSVAVARALPGAALAELPVGHGTREVPVAGCSRVPTGPCGAPCCSRPRCAFASVENINSEIAAAPKTRLLVTFVRRSETNFISPISVAKSPRINDRILCEEALQSH